MRWRLVTLVLVSACGKGTDEPAPAPAPPALAMPGVPIGLDAPGALQGWSVIPAPDGPFMIGDGHGRIASFGTFLRSQLPPGAAITDVSPGLFAGLDIPWTGGATLTREVGSVHRTFQRGAVEFDGTKLDAMITIADCVDPATSIFALLMGPVGMNADTAADLLAKVRCARPGDLPLPLTKATP